MGVAVRARLHKRGSHRRADRPVDNVLAVDKPIDPSEAVACHSGSAGRRSTTSRRYHTAPNTTDRPRLAYPMEFQARPVRRAVPVDMPWVMERRAATGEGPQFMYPADGRFQSV